MTARQSAGAQARPSRRTSTAGWALLLLAATCRAEPKPVATPTPARQPGVVLPSGAVYRVELARTPEELTRGLMFRENLPEGRGMLFLFPEPGIHRFWMKNTVIPLDIVWLGESNQVIFISANTPPCRADPCPTYGPATVVSSVLEIPAAAASKEKLLVGSRINFLNVNRLKP